MNLFLRAATLLVPPFLLTGCGDGKTAPPSASLDTIDACALLTTAEIEGATGITPGTPEDQTGSGPPMCIWPSQDGGYYFAANVLVAPSNNYTSFDEALAEWQEMAGDMGVEFDAAEYQQVDGPGDVNAWLHETGMLQAHRGNRMVQIWLQKVPPDRDRLQAATELAGHALARLD